MLANRNAPWNLLERFIVYELFCRNGRKSPTKNDLDVIATAQDLRRSIGSVTARIGNYTGLSNDYLSPIIDGIFSGDWMYISRLLAIAGYSPRVSFKATSNACRYFMDFPASAAHTLLGGRPFVGVRGNGFTPRIDIQDIIKHINHSAPKTSLTFDISSLLLDINYIFVTSSDVGNVTHIYEDVTNYADPDNQSNRILSCILDESCYFDYERELNRLISYLSNENSLQRYLDESESKEAIKSLKQRITYLENEIRVSLYRQFHDFTNNECTQIEPHISISEFSEPICIPTEDNRWIPIDPLGCYLPGQNTILLWVDRISAYGNLKELVFQKVLLHECIHALLDIKRQSSCDYREEETVDNTWVLYAYSNCEQSAVANEVMDFISKQPPEYSKALFNYPWMVIKNEQLFIIQEQTRNLLSWK